MSKNNTGFAYDSRQALVRNLGFIRYLFRYKKVPKNDTRTLIFNNFLALFGDLFGSKIYQKRTSYVAARERHVFGTSLVEPKTKKVPKTCLLRAAT